MAGEDDFFKAGKDEDNFFKFVKRFVVLIVLVVLLFFGVFLWAVVDLVQWITSK